MNKLTALIEAAKAATPGPWRNGWMMGNGKWRMDEAFSLEVATLDGMEVIQSGDRCGGVQKDEDATFIALANPATILELCVLLEKAEEALAHINEYWCGNRNDLAMFDACNNAVEVSEETLAAIKQWKEQT